MVLMTLLLALLLISFADAAIPNTTLRMMPRIPKYPIPDRPLMSSNGTTLPSLHTVYYFDQLIDHNNPGLGTFKQRYWMNWEFYEAGGPILLTTPPEANAEGYLILLTNLTIAGLTAQQECGATVLMEHRFFGYSNPYNNLTSESLQLLMVEQAIEDLVYFAQNVQLPMPGGDNVKPNTTPWVLFGGSYSGKRSYKLDNGEPGIFRAGYASSATVEAITNYYDFFAPILEYMPKNCSADLQAVIAYLDQKYEENDTVAIRSLKQAFGLGDLLHIDDFAAALQSILHYWLDLQPDRLGDGSMFFNFCDALEVKNGVSAPATGWGLKHAIQAWGSFWNSTYYAHLCGHSDPEACMGTYNTSSHVWTNVTVDNDLRSWYWMVCNQLGYYQVSPPAGQSTIVSRILQPVYYERICVNFFPERFSSPPTPSTRDINAKYKGWDVEVDRLFFATNRRDPWLGTTVSASGLKKANTTNQPIYLSDGFHVSDMIIANGAVDPTIRAVQIAALQYMKTWLA